MRIEASGFGAGLRQLDGVPNCTQVVTGELGASASPGTASGHPLVQLDTNLDDATGETLASALTTLVGAGALDAWVTPIVMKKGRPAHTVSVLCEPVLAGDLTALLHAVTGTLGVRAHSVDRWTAPRELDQVEVLGQRIRMKLSPGRVKAEHRDVERAATAARTPIIEIAARAEAAWREREGARAGPPATDLSPEPPPA